MLCDEGVLNERLGLNSAVFTVPDWLSDAVICLTLLLHFPICYVKKLPGGLLIDT